MSSQSPQLYDSSRAETSSPVASDVASQKTEINLNFCYKPNSQSKETQTGDGIVLLNVDTGKCFSASTVGCRIWALLRSGSTVSQVADVLSSEFAIPREEVLPDIIEFVTSLVNSGLVQTPAPQGAPNRKTFLGWLKIWKRSLVV